MLTKTEWKLVLDAAAKRGLKRRAEKWRERNRIPPEHVRDMESDTGIPKWKMRPDLYDKPSRAA